MKLTRRTHYALAALIDLASSPADGVLQVPRIARAHAISPKFLECALSDLRRAGIVHSRQGRGGGFSLARSPSDITIGAVMRALDDTFEPTCFLGDGADSQCPCPDKTTCTLRLTMLRLSTALTAVFDGISLDDIMQRPSNRTAQPADLPDCDMEALCAADDRGEKRIVTATT
jgi:Rrf2 family protein